MIPLMFDVKDKQILIVGGGGIALRRVKKLLSYEVLPEKITCIAPSICDEMIALGVICQFEPYHHESLSHKDLVIVATNDEALNLQIKKHCKARSIFCNVVSDKEASDFIFPASFNRGNLTFSVCTEGASPHLSKHIIEVLKKEYDQSWEQKIFLLEAIRKEIIKNKPTGATTLSKKDSTLLKQSVSLGVHELEELLKNLKEQ